MLLPLLVLVVLLRMRSCNKGAEEVLERCSC
jgi:hypothetical protein